MGIILYDLLDVTFRKILEPYSEKDKDIIKKYSGFFMLIIINFHITGTSNFLMVYLTGLLECPIIKCTNVSKVGQVWVG